MEDDPFGVWSDRAKEKADDDETMILEDKDDTVRPTRRKKKSGELPLENSFPAI